MDGSRFDALTRAAGNASSRRSLLGVALGGLTAAVLGDRADAAAVKRGPGEICRKNGDCASGTCGVADRTGRQRCATCIPIGVGMGGCASDQQCCQDSPSHCEDSLICLGGSHCCHELGGSCTDACDCCDLAACIQGLCTAVQSCASDEAC